MRCALVSVATQTEAAPARSKACAAARAVAAQTAPSRMESVVIEGVNRCARPTLVEPEDHSRDKWQRRHPAGPAHAATRRLVECVAIEHIIKRVTASRAGGTGHRLDRGPAVIANWNGRKPRQRGAANSAGGGQESTTNSIYRTSQHANHGAPPCSLRWRNVERQ